MTLRALFSAGYIGATRPSGAPDLASTTDVTLAFAFDSGYLMPFKVMIYSLCRQRSLLDCPVAIYSDDPAVFDDPIVKLVADKPRLLAPSQRDELYELAKTRVKRPERSDWNKGTFLKWAIFEKQLTPRLLFLDVDMLCLAPLEPLLASNHDVDIVAVPQFQTSIYKVREEVRPRDVIEATLLDMVNGTYNKAHRNRVNSGMMLLSSALLSGEFYRELISWSYKEVLINEQRHLSSLLENGSYSLKMIPVTFNFQERYLAFLPEERGTQTLRAIKILHFAGSGKPWKPGAHRARVSQAPWFEHFFDAYSQTQILLHRADRS